jgi:hypothetical protein
MIRAMFEQHTRFQFLPATLLGALLAGSTAGAVLADVQIAAGRITDLQGHPVAGALVKAEGWEAEPLGTAQSDAQGQFKISLSHPEKDLTLIVERPGFQRWSMSGMRPRKDGYRIHLTRTIDREYLTELAAQTEPARFQELARDLLTPSQGTTGETLPMEQVRPFLKTLRAQLRAMLPAEPAQVSVMELTRAQQTALSLLASLGDPRDQALVGAWTARTKSMALQ